MASKNKSTNIYYDSDNLQYDLLPNFKPQSLVFRADSIEEIINKRYKLKSGIKNTKLKGQIHGHGKMRRENLEASYKRTEDYTEKLRAEGEKRKNSKP